MQMCQQEKLSEEIPQQSQSSRHHLDYEPWDMLSIATLLAGTTDAGMLPVNLFGFTRSLVEYAQCLPLRRASHHLEDKYRIRELRAPGTIGATCQGS